MNAAAQAGMLGEDGLRVRLGAAPGTPSPVLAALSRDPRIAVRAAVALNPAASADANRQLATDSDERVRLLLARKMLSMAPDLPREEQTRLRERTFGILSTLVRDEAVRVRATIAEVLATLPDAPRDLVLNLAQDASLSVSEPVLRLSPLLSDADLLVLLQQHRNTGAATAIAQRANLAEAVADAIAATTDSVAIRALLANGSAAIRESTLDGLIARAQSQPDWHEPLVQRPALPDHAARALSEIVTEQLLDVLCNRPDLRPSLVAELKLRLVHRLAEARNRATPAPDPSHGDLAALEHARFLDARGALDEPALLEAAALGQARRTAAMLAVAAGVPLETVDRAAALRSGKGLVSLAWKAGFTMRSGNAVQILLGQIGPSKLLTATQAGNFPLRADEMAWQLDFLGGARS